MFPPDITCICQWLWVVVKGDGGAMREQEEKEEEVYTLGQFLAISIFLPH